MHADNKGSAARQWRALMVVVDMGLTVRSLSIIKYHATRLKLGMPSSPREEIKTPRVC